MLLPHHTPALPHSSTTTYFRLSVHDCVAFRLCRTSRDSKQHTAPRSPTPPPATTSITDVLFVAFASHGRLAAPTFYVPENGTQLSRRPANIGRGVRRPTYQQSRQECRGIAEQGEYCQNGWPLCNYSGSSEKLFGGCSGTMVKVSVGVLPYADERISLYKSKLQFTHYLTYIRIHSPHGSEFSLTWE